MGVFLERLFDRERVLVFAFVVVLRMLMEGKG